MTKNIKNITFNLIPSFLVGLILVGLTIILPITKVIAIENNPALLAKNSSWSTASFPVERFQAYTSPFGYRRSPNGGRWEFHNGLDIAAPKGSYIRNWWGGTVIKVGDRGGCGTHIIVKSGNWRHSYCHMQGRVQKINGRLAMIDTGGGIQIWQGQQIPSGARIGRIGMTGRTTGPHLHWVLRYGQNYVDPAKVLRVMLSKGQITKTSSIGVSQQSQIKVEESKILNQ